MSITKIGSLSNYMRSLKLQTQWQLKKQSGELTNEKKSLQEWLEDSSSSSLLKFRKSANNTGNINVEAIYAKVQNGKKLTTAEKEYLRTADPETYEKANDIERERKSYEQEINRCKTQEEIQRVKTSRLSVSLSTVTSIESNPHIPFAKKLEYTLLEQAKTHAIEEVTMKFIESEEYSKLPTDAEYDEAMAELEQSSNPKPEEPKKEGSQEVSKENPDNETETSQDIQNFPLVSDSDSEPEIESPELRKTKWEKAKAAYQHLAQKWEAEDDFAINGFASFDAKG